MGDCTVINLDLDLKKLHCIYLCRSFMEVNETVEPTTGPKEKQMSATQMAHEIMSGGEKSNDMCGDKERKDKKKKERLMLNFWLCATCK